MLVTRVARPAARPKAIGSVPAPGLGRFERRCRWSKVEAWYTENVDRAPPGPARSAHPLRHQHQSKRARAAGGCAFRRGPVQNQPPAVVEVLRNGARGCRLAAASAFVRPRHQGPLVRRVLWTDLPGMCFAFCDIAGGARAWDYSKYNPWGITGDAQTTSIRSGAWCCHRRVPGFPSRRCSSRATRIRRSRRLVLR